MISNYDRIHREIVTEVQKVCEDLDFDPQTLEDLIMEIVDLEDQHRVTGVHAIKKKMRNLIEATAVAQGTESWNRD